MNHPIQLLRVQDQQVVDAILTEVTEKHLEDAKTLWEPLLRGSQQEDEYWNWLRKSRQSKIIPGDELYAIECDRLTQGLIMLDIEKKRYAQGFHLALYDKPLFAESVEAWTHGPVVPELYNAYKYYGSSSIPIPNDIDFSNYDEQTRELLDEVYCVYGQFSAWKLRNMTHDEEPWKDAHEGNMIISPQTMKQYFKTQLVNH